MSGVNAGKRSPAFGISLMALAWHLSSQSYQAGNPGYSGSEQARPAFAVLAVVAATAATIVLASRWRGDQRSGPGRGARQMRTTQGHLAPQAGPDQPLAKIE